MRIRKRQVPLPLSSLSPVPLSDLHMEPPVQLPPPPSDHQNQRLSLIRRLSGDLEEDEEARSWNKGEIKKSNDSKNPSPISSSNNVQAGQRWCDGDEAFPPKKRRGRGNDHNNVEKDGATGTMKSKMKNKSSPRRTDDDDIDNGIVIMTTKNKKNMRSGKGGEAAAEGSRCSRVNGRGWRCCQQTLAGYSLCEHHLGKGRLRSGISASPKMTRKNKKNFVIDRSTAPSGTDRRDDELESESKPALEDEEENRVKLGTVKARSMSSLLGQTQQEVIVTYAVARDHDHVQI